MSGLPDELRELDHVLRALRFEPRASLGPEIVGRAARGETPANSASPTGGAHRRTAGPRIGRRRALAAAALAAVLCALALGVRSVRHPPPVTIDRCCYDLDGGGEIDDGIRVVAQRNAAVERLWIYEDLDRSGGFTARDVVRLERGGAPVLAEAGAGALVAREHCCVDFDGGGPADDGLLLMGVPPDRVLMAAIYERESATNPSGRLPLR